MTLDLSQFILPVGELAFRAVAAAAFFFPAPAQLRLVECLLPVSRVIRIVALCRARELASQRSTVRDTIPAGTDCELAAVLGLYPSHQADVGRVRVGRTVELIEQREVRRNDARAVHLTSSERGLHVVVEQSKSCWVT